MKKIGLLSIFFLHFNLSFSQIGGENTYQFLDLDFNSRSMALGGDFALANDGDINLAVANPAMISDKMDARLSLNHAIFPSGINYGQVVYGKKIKQKMFTTHLRYVEYGKFTRTNAQGIEEGKFTAGDYALGVGYGHQLNKYFSVGGNFNLIFSHLESYTSFGVSTDMTAQFYDEKSNVTAIIIARNIGYQIKSYTKKNKEPLPIELLAGVSYKFLHAPFRLSLMVHDLNRWDLSYNIPDAQPTIDVLTGDTIPVPKAKFTEKLFRHLNFGVEILPTNNFSIRLGYNFNRRKSLGVEGRMSIGGFSAGVGFKIKKFEFDYALAIYSSAGTSNMFTITTNLNEWRRKRE
ncbi:MAG TPA: type IX secretion system protein PorQ [Crocinitomix sp.]|nr:type IX secretion system protein PorQ [Crocinitomix sp.]